MSVVSALSVRCKPLSGETPNQSRPSLTTEDGGNRSIFSCFRVAAGHEIPAVCPIFKLRGKHYVVVNQLEITQSKLTLQTNCIFGIIFWHKCFTNVVVLRFRAVIGLVWELSPERRDCCHRSALSWFLSTLCTPGLISCLCVAGTVQNLSNVT